VLETWTKKALLEMQEYVRLVFEAIRDTFTRPFYFRDVVEQFDSIGVGSLVVVLLTGFFTGAPPREKVNSCCVSSWARSDARSAFANC